MKKMMTSGMWGAITALVLTSVVLMPAWLFPGAEWWHKMPEWLGRPIGAFMFFGWLVGEAYHTPHVHLGCRSIHFGLIVTTSFIVNAFVGAAVGVVVGAIRQRIKRGSNNTSDGIQQPADGLPKPSR